MADAGAMYYSALSGAGNDIANAMIRYHQEHQAYDQQFGIANALSRIGVNAEGRIVPIATDEKGKPDKSIQPIIDPKALEMFSTSNRRDWAKSAGALEALSRLGMSYVNRASEENISPKFPVTTAAGRTIPATAGQAIQADLEQQRIEGSMQAGQVREARAQRTEARMERGEKREDVRLGLSTASAQRAELEKRPEREFSRKYGLTPQALIGIQETPYLAMNEKGAVIGENEPLSPGETVKDYSNKPGWMKELITLGFAAPTKIQWQAKDPQNMVFRESKYEYGGSAKQGTPKREQWATNPAGEVLNVRGTRIPLEEVSRIQNQATSVRKELLEKFKAKPQLLPAFRERLATLGYDPYNEFWGLPQDQ